jgi:citrate synthase
LAVVDGAINASDLRSIKTSADDFGLLSYDPGFSNTASCRSGITFIDGDRGILEYRGYPIEQLAEKSSYPAVTQLLIEGELADPAGLEAWKGRLAAEASVPTDLLTALGGLSPTAHPMSLLGGLAALLGGGHWEARELGDPANNLLQAQRLIAQMATLAAAIFRHGKHLAHRPPRPELGFTGSFMDMLFGDRDEYRPDPTLERALDILFILHADHEQNCSTNVVRGTASSDADPYSVVSAGVGALSGPLHGGANEAVLAMLREIGTKDRVPAFVEEVKSHKRKLMGFGHRVYKSYDPRARIVKQTADDVFAVTGVNPLLEIAIALEQVALNDAYFVERKLYPNVDFYSGLIYEAMGFPSEFFTVLFAVARTSGWVAHWLEMLSDPERRIARPRQIYTGSARRNLQS